MAVTVTGLTVHTQTGGGTWTDYGTGGGSSDTTNNFFSSTSARGRKFSGIKGMAFEVNATGADFRNTVVLIRYLLVGGFAATIASAGGVIRLEDTSGNQSDWNVAGSDTYKAGYQIVAISTSNAETSNNGTAATLSSIRYAGFVVNAAGGSGGDPNFYIDEVLSLPDAGLTVSGNTASLVADLIAFDDANLYGVIESRSGVAFSRASLVLAPDATGIGTSDESLVFEDPVYYDGTNTDSSLATVSLSSTDADPITLTRFSCTANANPDVNGADAARSIDFNSAADVTVINSTLRGFDAATNPVRLGASTNTYTGATFQDCGQVTDTGAVLRSCVFRNSTDTTGSYLWNNATSDVESSAFDVASGGHGIEHDTIESVATGTVTTADATGTTLIDSAASFTTSTAVGEYIYNETDGSYGKITSIDSATQVTCETLQGGTDNDFDLADAYSISPAQTYTDLTFSGAGTHVNNTATGSDGLFVSKSGTSNPSTATGNVVFIGSVPVTITVVDGTNAAIENAQTTVRLSSDNSEIINADTNASGQVSGSFTGTTPATALVKVRKSSPGDVRYQNFSTTGTISTSGLSVTVVLTEDGAL